MLLDPFFNSSSSISYIYIYINVFAFLASACGDEGILRW